MVQRWQVVGGVDSGGLVVRQGQDLKSAVAKERLATDSIVDELALMGQRLSYRLVEGSGPGLGWVSIALKGTNLCLKEEEVTKKVEAPPERLSLDYQQSAACRERCENEKRRPVPGWKPITFDHVMEGHDKAAPGMFYGLDFPWSEETLLQQGAAWLTKAFHAAGTLDSSNAVTKIIPEKKVKVTTGNNGGKFLFEVRYKRSEPGLHTKLFAKVPHSYAGKTRQDRLSSSVNKQPMEFYELNCSRLLESTLPVKIPQYYFADISNETSNFILITEQVPFKDWAALDFEGKTVGNRRGPLAPYVVEGPYDKCMDWTLRGDPKEYYLALVRAGGKMGGLQKAGKMGEPELLATQFEDFTNKAKDVWGVRPECTGAPPAQFKPVIEAAMKFWSEDAQVIFPSFCSTQDFQAQFYSTMMTMNAYAAESNFWRHSDQDYIALTHNNMNVDNAFFWRGEDGSLDLGVLDWGSMGQRSLGFKLWYWLYCADYDVLTDNMDAFLQCFIDAYAESGGPTLDKEVLRTQFILSACEQMFGLMKAVPQIFRMCAKKEWPTIQTRYDSRIGQNIDGKSTMRLYLHVQRNIMGIVCDPKWRGAEAMQQWVEDFGKAHGLKKDDSVIFP